MILLGRARGPAAYIGSGTATSTLTAPVNASVAARDYAIFMAVHNANSAITPGTGTTLQNANSGATAQTLSGKRCASNAETIVYTGPASIMRLRSHAWRTIRVGAVAAGSATGTGTATTLTLPALVLTRPRATVVICVHVKKASLTFGHTMSYKGRLTEEATGANASNSSWFVYIRDCHRFQGGGVSWDATSNEYRYSLCWFY